jgi:hypothetical protein
MSSSYTRAAVTYQWDCASCGCVGLQPFFVSPRGEIPLPTMPEGWTRVGVGFPRFYCPRHTVKELLIVDGQVTVL